MNLKIERMDNAKFPICVKKLFVDAVSAVDISSVDWIDMCDDALEKIYKISLNT